MHAFVRCRILFECNQLAQGLGLLAPRNVRQGILRVNLLSLVLNESERRDKVLEHVDAFDQEGLGLKVRATLCAIRVRQQKTFFLEGGALLQTKHVRFRIQGSGNTRRPYCVGVRLVMCKGCTLAELSLAHLVDSRVRRNRLHPLVELLAPLVKEVSLQRIQVAGCMCRAPLL